MTDLRVGLVLGCIGLLAEWAYLECREVVMRPSYAAPADEEFPVFPPAVGNLQDFRQVSCTWQHGERTRYIIHKDEVEEFVEATLKLHHEPGFNPHNHGQTTGVTRITSCRLCVHGPYWWTSRTLKEGRGGAHLIDVGGEDTVHFDLYPEQE